MQENDEYMRESEEFKKKLATKKQNIKEVTELYDAL